MSSLGTTQGHMMATVYVETIASIVAFGTTAAAMVAWKFQEVRIIHQPGQASSKFRLVRHLSTFSNWSDYSDDQERFIQDFPKVELHVHLDGSFDADFLWKYLQQNPDTIYCLPVTSNPPWDPGKELRIRDMVQNCTKSKDLHDLCTCRGYRSLKEMLNCFEVFLPIVRGNLDLIEQLAYDFCQRQWEQNIVYTEVRYSPHLLAESITADSAINDDEKNTTTDPGTNDAVVTPLAVFNAVTRGLRRGCATFDHITVNQILCCIAWRPDWASSTLDIASQHLQDFPCAVVGVDIAAGEEHFDRMNHPDLFGPHFEVAVAAKTRGIPLTLHAGESTELALDNVQRAVTEYGACRIGHGYRMVDSPNVMQLVRDNNIHVEVCPTSSNETGGWVYNNDKDWTQHPAIIMRQHGVSLSISSDDPAVFHTSLSWQYRLAVAKMGLSHRDIVHMNLDAVKAAWCPSSEKDRLRALILSHAKTYSMDDHFDTGNEITIVPETTSPMLLWKDRRPDSFYDRVYINGKERL